MFFNGHAPMDAHGTSRLVPKPLVGAIWMFFNGHVLLDARGMGGLVVKPPKVAIWRFFSGCAKTIAHGTRRAFVIVLPRKGT